MLYTFSPLNWNVCARESNQLEVSSLNKLDVVLSDLFGIDSISVKQCSPQIFSKFEITPLSIKIMNWLFEITSCLIMNIRLISKEQREK